MDTTHAPYRKKPVTDRVRTIGTEDAKSHGPKLHSPGIRLRRTREPDGRGLVAGSEMFPVVRRRPDTALSFPDGAERLRSRRPASPAMCNSAQYAALVASTTSGKGTIEKSR